MPLIGFAGAPFTVASYLVEGGPTRTCGRTKALMYGDDRALARAARPPRRPRHRVAAVAGRRRAPRRSSCSTRGPVSCIAADYRRYVLPHSAKVLAGVADLGVPRIHFGVGTGELLVAMAEAGADVVGVDWRVPLDEARAPPRRRRPVQGNLDPAVVLCAVGGRATRQAGEVLAQQRRRGPGTSSTSATGVLPETDPGRPRAARRPRPRLVGVTRPHRRRAHGLRHAAPRRTTIEAYYTDIRRGRPPTPEQLADLVGAATTPSAASRRSPSAPRPSAPACRPRSTPGRRRATEVVLGMKHAEPTIEAAVAGAGGRGRRAGPSGSCWRRTTRPSASASTSSGPRRRRGRAASRSLGIERWHLVPAYVEFEARRCPSTAWPACPPARRCCSPPTACPSGSSPPATPTPTSCEPRPRPWPRPPGWRRGRRGRLAWQSAGRTPEPWLGPDVLAVIDDLAAREGADRRAGVRRAASWPTTSRCSTTSTSRRAARAERPGPRLRPHPVRERRPGGAGRAGRPRVTQARRPVRPTSPSSAAASPGWRGDRLRAAPGGGDSAPTVTLFEADDRLGGKIRTSPFAGLPAVDEGADAFLARVPWAVDLAAELGLDDLVSPATGRAYVWWDGALHPIPEGLVLGVPAGLGSPGPLAPASWPGKAQGRARAARAARPPRGRQPRRAHRAPLRRRGARPAGRPARRQHQRRRRRPPQPGGHRARRSPRARPARAASCSACRKRPGSGARRPGLPRARARAWRPWSTRSVSALDGVRRAARAAGRGARASAARAAGLVDGHRGRRRRAGAARRTRRRGCLAACRPDGGAAWAPSRTRRS